MAKIETYILATQPLSFSDMLIGTEVGGPIPNATKNFSLAELYNLFASLPAVGNLQQTLNAGNTATQNIFLTGDITSTNIKPTYIIDGLNTTGAVGEVLIRSFSGISWGPIPPATIQQVLNAGNTATQNIILTGNITSTQVIPGNIKDGLGNLGITGQILSKTSTGIQWINNVAGVQDLQSVLNIGNTATSNIGLTGDITVSGKILIGNPNNTSVPLCVGGNGVYSQGSIRIANGQALYLGQLPLNDIGNRIKLATDFTSAYFDFYNTLFFRSGASSSSTVMTLFSNGNLALNTTTDTGFKLNVNGSIFGTLLAVNTSGQEKTITTFYGVGSIGQNIFIGGGGLFSNTGGGSSVNGSYNTSLGGDSLIANTIGSRNVAIGFDALRLNTTGNQNTAIGARTLTLNTTGIQNTAVGLNALYYTTTGYLNTGIGRQSLHNNDTGYSNTGIGHDTLYLNTTGYQNFAGGRNALYNNTTGFNNIAIGNGTGTTNTTGSNNIFIGNGTTGVAATDSNRTFIGNSSTTSTWLGGNVLIGTTTDVASSKLTINSTTQGFLPPRMTTVQKNAIVTPAAGLMVYDTTLNKLCVFTTVWETITSI